MNILNQKIESLENEKQEMSESNDMLKIKLKDIQNRNDDEKDNGSKSKPTPSLADTQRQMEIYWSDLARVKSLYLCSGKMDINGKDMSFKNG